jgi:hypothetical protein
LKGTGVPVLLSVALWGAAPSGESVR